MDPKQRLLQMLIYKRPHLSESEHDFIRRFILPYKPIVDGFNNLIIVTDPTSRTLFSCHTDTVHHSAGMQEILYDAGTEHVFKKDGEPLGADDALGCWMLLEMIDARVPGTYIFHRAEEVGGKGSGWVRDNKRDWLKQFDRAIAFDRKDVCSVITHQRWHRCCSDAFADALCEGLALGHEKDDGGVFTDTANYDKLIPECTNISAGYYDEHTPNEMQNVEYALNLREAALQLDWEALPVQRDPSRYEEKSYPAYGSWGKTPRYVPPPEFDEVCRMDLEELKDACWEHSDVMAEYLYEFICLYMGAAPYDSDDDNLGDDARGFNRSVQP